LRPSITFYKTVLYTAIIFGWPKEYRNSQQHESSKGPNQKYLSNHIWSHALKQAPPATINVAFCHSFTLPTYPLGAILQLNPIRTLFNLVARNLCRSQADVLCFLLPIIAPATCLRIVPFAPSEHQSMLFPMGRSLSCLPFFQRFYTEIGLKALVSSPVDVKNTLSAAPCPTTGVWQLYTQPHPVHVVPGQFRRDDRALQ
jgi:hypothetical protein